MLKKRFSLAKEYEESFSTPLLLRCENDVKINEDSFEIFGRTIRRNVLYSPSIKQTEIKISDDFYLIPNVNTLLRNTRDFVEYTLKIREIYGYKAIFYAPAVPSSLYPVLFYLGYDVFDDCMEQVQCHSLWGKSQSCSENSKIIFDMMISAFKENRLREFVESIPDNKSQEIIRYLDMYHYEEVERFYPIYLDSVNAVSHNSLYRPDILRWRKRLMERYKKPDYGKHLLLLPCSAKKPYSLSKSHRLMAKYTKSTMHEVILTSPLGIVPRELESFYPAKNYDIPVIGHWYEEEKMIIKDMLQWYLNKFEYEGIISYLPDSMRFLEPVLEKYGARMIWGMDTSELAEQTSKLGYRVPWNRVLRNNLSSLAKFQFGCCDDFSDVKIKGRYPRIDVWKSGERLFGYDIHRGMLTLTKKSAEILSCEKRYRVEIEDFYPEGDVFAVGVLSADPYIREGDEVAIVHKDEVRGWGIARMSAYDMVEENRGKAVKVRGRISQ